MTRTRKPEYINEYGSNSEYGSSTRLCAQISEYGMATRTCFCTQISENLAQYQWDIRYHSIGIDKKGMINKNAFHAFFSLLASPRTTYSSAVCVMHMY